MRTQVLVLAGGLLMAALLTGCQTETAGMASVLSGSGSSQVDIRPTTTPRAGDCVGSEQDQLWVVDCANRNAVARVTRQVPTGQSDQCTVDDYTGFDFSNDKPSLCLMLYGHDGDCYREFATRVATGGRVDCTDPAAKVRLQRIIVGDGRDKCRRLTPPGDPNAAALFYGKAPDFDAGSGAVHDVTYCLASPAKAH
jgi:hypothetical protein